MEGLVNKVHSRATGKGRACLFGTRASQQHVPYSQAPSTLAAASILSQVASRLLCRMSLAAFVYIGFCESFAFRCKYLFMLYTNARICLKLPNTCLPDQKHPKSGLSAGIRISSRINVRPWLAFQLPWAAPVTQPRARACSQDYQLAGTPNTANEHIRIYDHICARRNKLSHHNATTLRCLLSHLLVAPLLLRFSSRG